jgi:hypothetical protein
MPVDTLFDQTRVINAFSFREVTLDKNYKVEDLKKSAG